LKRTICFSITYFSGLIFYHFLESQAGGSGMVFPKHYEAKSYDLPVESRDAGQFCWMRLQAWREQSPLPRPNSFTLNLSQWWVKNIDTEDDLYFPELVT
jgi:N-acylneuraminate cytidylyltransferase